MTAVLSVVTVVAAVCVAAVSGFYLTEEWHSAYTAVYLNQTSPTPVYVFVNHSRKAEAEQNPSLLRVCDAIFNRSYQDQGWDYVYLAPNQGNLSDMGSWYYTSGFAEGYLTFDRINDLYWNISEFMTKEEGQFVDSHLAFMQNMSDPNNNSTNSTNFWPRVYSVMQQLQGLADGYNARLVTVPVQNGTQGRPSFAFRDMFLYNFGDEMGDVARAVSPPVPHAATTNNNGGASESVVARLLRQKNREHCSALVKVTARDLFVGHATWTTPELMTQRQFKTYEFDTVVSFSALPGLVASGDDWYMTSNLLAVQETSLAVFNQDLLRQYVAPETVSEFIRVMVANYVGTDGPSWIHEFEQQNSGTYNNAYMVVNMNQFTPSLQRTLTATLDQLQPGTLYLIEQMPGNVTSADVTPVLQQQGYFASYNIPFFSNVYSALGYAEKYEATGNFWSESRTPRAEIFARDHVSVVDLPSMMAIMRSNNYLHDPLSRIQNCTGTPNDTCDPAYSAMLAVASRGDLNAPGNASNYGPDYQMLDQRGVMAVDAKITSWTQLQDNLGTGQLHLTGVVVSGPPHDEANGVPIFKWSDAPAVCGRCPAGAPDAYDFAWQTYRIPVSPHGYYGDYPLTSTIAISVGVTFAVSFVLILVLLLVRRSKIRREDERQDADGVSLLPA